MDPLLTICGVNSSITANTEFDVEIISIRDRLKLEVVSYPPPVINAEKLVSLTVIHNNRRLYNLIRDYVDGINLGLISKNRAGNKLVNMIFVYPSLVLPYKIDYDAISRRRVIDSINLPTDHNLTVCDVAGGPGSWSLIMLSKFPNSRVVGVTLNDPAFLWYGELLSHPRFTHYYRDLIEDYDEFASIVREEYPNGMDLCMCYGGNSYSMNNDSEEGDDRDQAVRHKLLNIMIKARLIAAEILTSLLINRVGGCMILKIFYRDHPIVISLISIISMCYQFVSIIKPITTRTHSKEVFVIGLYRRKNIQQYIDHLREIMNNWESYIAPYTVIEVPSALEDYIRRGLDVESHKYNLVKKNVDTIITDILSENSNPTINYIKRYLTSISKNYIVNRDINSYTISALLSDV